MHPLDLQIEQTQSAKVDDSPLAEYGSIKHISIIQEIAEEGILWRYQAKDLNDSTSAFFEGVLLSLSAFQLIIIISFMTRKGVENSTSSI